MGDAARRILEGVAASLPPPNPAAFDPQRICGCSHWDTDHHGPEGRGRCGEDGCDCAGWHPADIECPDCSADWPILDGACPVCGLSVEAIAERLATLHRLALLLGREGQQ